ncbi:Cruciform DNA binding protein, partial [Dispira simplex]
MADASHSPQEVTNVESVPHTFTWCQGNPDTVIVTGSFDGWSKENVMDRNVVSSEEHNHEGRVQFTKSVQIPVESSPVLYKYVVDGEWVHDPHNETVVGDDGIINNVLHIQIKSEVQSVQETAVEISNSLTEDVQLIVNTGDREDEAIDLGPVSPVKDETNHNEPSNPDNLSERNSPNVSLTKGESDEVDIGTQSQVESSHAKTDSMVSLSPGTKNPDDNSPANDTVIEAPEVSSVSIDAVASPLNLEEESLTTEVTLPANDDHAISGIQNFTTDHIEATIESTTATPPKTEEGPIAATVEKPTTEVEQAPVESHIQESIETPGTDETAADEAPQPTPQECAVDDIKEFSQSVVPNDDVAPTVGSPEVTGPVDAGFGVEAEIAIVQAELSPQVAGGNICQVSSPTTSEDAVSETVVANVPLVNEEGTSDESIPSQAEESVIPVDTTPATEGCSDEVELIDIATVAEDVIYEVDNSAPYSQGDSEEAGSTPESVVGVVEDDNSTTMESNEEPESVKVKRLPEELFEEAEEPLKSVNPVEVEPTEQNQTITEPAESISLGEVKDEPASADAEVSTSEDNIAIQDKEAETTETTAKVLPEAESSVPEITDGEVTTAVVEEICSPVAVEESTAVVTETETNDDSPSEPVEENMAEVHPTEDGQQVSVEVLPFEVVETTQTPTQEIPLDECHPSKVVEETPAVDLSTSEKSNDPSGEVVPDESSAMEPEEREKIPIVEEQHTKQPLSTTTSAVVHSNHVDPETPSEVVADTALNGKLLSDEPNVVTSTPSEDKVSPTELTESAEESSEKLDSVIENEPTVEDQSTHEAAEFTGGAMATETDVMVPETSQKETVPVIMEAADFPAVVKGSSEESQANDDFVTELVQENQVNVDTAEDVADMLAKSDLVKQTEISKNHAEESAAFEIVDENLTVEESPTELVAQPSDETLPVPTEVPSPEIPEAIPTDDSEIIETREPEGLPVTEESPVKEIQPATGNPEATSHSGDTEITSEKVVEGVNEKDLIIAESTQTPAESSDTAEESSTTVDSVVNVPAVEDQTNNEAVYDAILTVAIGEYASSVPEVITYDADGPEVESQDELAETIAELTPEADIVAHEAVEGEDTSPTVVEFTEVAQPVKDLFVQAANDDQVEVSPAEAVAVVTKEGMVTETHSEQVVEVVDKKDLVIAESVDTYVESTESAEESSKIVESVVPAVEDDRSTETMDDAFPADATEETIAALPEDMVAEANVFVEPSEVTAELTPEAEVVVSETVVETVPVMVDDAISPVVIEEVPEEPQLIEDLVAEPVNGDQAEISTSEEASVVSQVVVLTETPSEVVAKDGDCKDLVVAESNETPAGSTELAANSAKPTDAVQPAVENIANTEAMDEVVPTTASEEPIAIVPEVVTVSEADDTVKSSEDEPVEAVVEESSETVKEEAMPVVMEDTTSPVFMEETPEVPHTYSESVTEPVEEDPLDVTATGEVFEMSAVCDTAPVVDAIDTLAEEGHVDSSVNPELLPAAAEGVEVVEKSSVSLEPTVTSSDAVIEPISLPEEAAVPEIVENTPAVQTSPIEVAAESSDETLPVPTELPSQEAPKVVPTDDSERVGSEEPEELPVTDISQAEEKQPATDSPGVTRCSADASSLSEVAVDDLVNIDLVITKSIEAQAGSSGTAEESSTTADSVVNVPAVENKYDAETVFEAVPTDSTKETAIVLPEIASADAEVPVGESEVEPAEVTPDLLITAHESLVEEIEPVVVESTDVPSSIGVLSVTPVNGDQLDPAPAEEALEFSMEAIVTDTDDNDFVVVESAEAPVESTELADESLKIVDLVVEVSFTAKSENVTAETDVAVKKSKVKAIETAAEFTPEAETVVPATVDEETVPVITEDINSSMVAKEASEEPQMVKDVAVEPVNGDQVEGATVEEITCISEGVIVTESFSEVVEHVDEPVDAPIESTEFAKESSETLESAVPSVEDDAVPTGVAKEPVAALPEVGTVESDVAFEKRRNEPTETISQLTRDAEAVVPEAVEEVAGSVAGEVTDSPVAVDEVSRMPQPKKDPVVQSPNDYQVEDTTPEDPEDSGEVEITESPSEGVVADVDHKDLVDAESTNAPERPTKLPEESPKTPDSPVHVPIVENKCDAKTTGEIIPSKATEVPGATVPEVAIVSETDSTVESSEVEPVEAVVEESSETVKEEAMPVVMEDTTSSVFVEETPKVTHTYSESVTEPVEEDPLDVAATGEAFEMSAVCDTATVVDAIDTMAEEGHVDSSVNPELLPAAAEGVEVVEESSVSLEPKVTSSDVVIEPISLREEAVVPEIVENTPAVEASPIEVAEKSSDETLPVPTEFPSQESPEVVPTDDSERVGSEEPEGLQVTDISLDEGSKLTTGNPGVTRRSVDADHSSEEVVDDFDNNGLVVAESTEASEGSTDTAGESSTDSAVVNVLTLELNTNNQTASEAVPVETAEDSVAANVEVSTSEADVVVDTSQGELVDGTAEISSELGIVVPEPVILEAREVSQPVENVAVEPVNDDQEKVSTVAEDSGIAEEVVITETPSEGMVEDVDNKDLVLAESTEVSAESTESAKEPWKTVESVVNVPAVEDICDGEVVANEIPTESTEEVALFMPEVVTANAEVPVEESEGETIQATAEVTPDVEITVPEVVEVAVLRVVVDDPKVPKQMGDPVVQTVIDEQVEETAIEVTTVVSEQLIGTATLSEEVIEDVKKNLVVSESSETSEVLSESADESSIAVDFVVDTPVEEGTSSVTLDVTDSPLIVEEVSEEPQPVEDLIIEPVDGDQVQVFAVKEDSEISAEAVIAETITEKMVEYVSDKDMVVTDFSDSSPASMELAAETSKPVVEVVEVPVVEDNTHTETGDEVVSVKSAEGTVAATLEAVTAVADVAVEESQDEPIETTTDVMPDVEIMVLEAVELETDATV